jgi:hypothetical protein
MKNFIRKVEDFVCLNCGQKVEGDGYTDHCPLCLWGRHVDKLIPGDRKSRCLGMMKPMSAAYEKNVFRIKYSCQKCNHKFVVREGKNDNREELLKLSCGENTDYLR